MFIEWNLISLGGPTHAIVTKTVHNPHAGVTFWSVLNVALCSYFQSDLFQICRNISLLPPLHGLIRIFGINIDVMRNDLHYVGLHWRVPFIEVFSETVQVVW